MGGEAHQSENNTAHKGADDAHHDIPQEAALQIHQPSGDPAHQGAHDQGTNHL